MLAPRRPSTGSSPGVAEASNWSLRLSGQDIDPLVLGCLRINAALYAPWLLRPYPEAFFAEADAERGAGEAPVLVPAAPAPVLPPAPLPGEQGALF
jgi:hypothetical protein